jgi:hypothetical protein
MSVYYEILGYIASVLIATSLMMTAVVKLRIMNLIGAACFATYGILIGSVPVSVMNVVIVLINIFHLYRMSRTKEFFKLLPVPMDSPYLHHFLSFYEKQIRRFQPAFDFQPCADWMPVFILRDAVPAGLVLGTQVAPHRLRIVLDFAIPKYRDFKIARYLFEHRKDIFRERNITDIESPEGHPTHNDYLERMGFKRDPENSTLYVLHLGD